MKDAAETADIMLTVGDMNIGNEKGNLVHSNYARQEGKSS